MRNFATSTILLIAVFLNAYASGSDVTYHLTVQSSDPATIEATNQVLLARFRHVLPSLVSTVDSEVSGPNISYTFRRGAPDDSIVNYLCRTTGHFSMSLAEQNSDKLWVTDLDIKRAEVEMSGYGPMILIQLSEDAGERLRLLTTQNLGNVVTSKLDDKTLVEAHIRGVFAAVFQVPAPRNADAYAVAAILESGPLPAPVALRILQDGA